MQAVSIKDGNIIIFPQLIFLRFQWPSSKCSSDSSHEVNLSVRQSGFTIYRRYKPEKENEILVKAGSPLRLFHKEIEAYLTCEGLFGDEVTENGENRFQTLVTNDASRVQLNQL